MRRLKHIINWTVWSLLGLYVILVVLIHMPSVQSRLGRGMASAIGNVIGTEVSIGRIDLGFLNRIILDHVVIKDQAGDEMLRANRMTVKLAPLHLLEGRVSISSAQVFGANINLYQQDSLSAPNYQFVVDALSSDDTDDEGSSVDLRINSLIIRHSSVRFDRRHTPETPHKLNTDHLAFNDISAHIILKTLSSDSLNVSVKRLAFTEQSGLNVTRLALHVEGNDQGARADGLEVSMPRSSITVDSVIARYDLDNFVETLTYKASVGHAQIALGDMSFVEPSLAASSHSIAVDTRLEGDSRGIDIPQLSVTSDDNGLQVMASGSVSMADSVASWHVKMTRFKASSSFIDDMMALTGHIPDVIARLGNIDLAGEASRGRDGTTDASAAVLSDAGNMLLRMQMDKDMNFSGHLDTDSLDIGQLARQDVLGKMATQLDFRGNSHSVRMDGTVSKIGLGDYDYQNIDLDITYDSGDISGRVRIDDPNIQTDIEGHVHKAARTAIRLTGYINNLRPEALHLSDRWGNATFSAVVDADFMASDLNDAEGSIDLDDFVMAYPDSVGAIYQIDNLHIKSGYDDGKHYLHVNGDMGEAEVEGQFNWHTLSQSLINYTASRLPTLPGLPEVRPSANNFEINLRLDDAQWLKRLLGVNLTLERPLVLYMAVDDNASQLDIAGNMPSFTYNDSRYGGGRISLNTYGDTTRLDIELSRIRDGVPPTDVALSAIAADGQLNTTVRWDNNATADHPEEAMSGTVNSIARVYTNEQDKPEAHVRVLPSEMTIAGSAWQLEPCDIIYSDRRLMVDHFNLGQGAQRLIIDGTASDSPLDSLVVSMSNIDVGYVLDLVGFESVSFGGMATGTACLTQPFSDMNAWADMEVDQFTFEQGRMGTLIARAEWSPEDRQVDIEAVADDGAESQTFIDGFIAPSRDDIDLYIRARGTNIEFAGTFTSSFLSNVAGQASGDVRVIGPLSKVNLTGQLAVEGQASVQALGTTYQLRGDSITFTPNLISFKNHRIYDRDDHEATLSGSVTHHNFKDFGFDLSVDTRNLLAYDFPSFDESTICGTVYADGHADLHGRPGEVTIDCDIAPRPNSFFAYNAANPDAINNQEFITWGDASVATPEAVSHEPQADAPQTGSDIRINFLINANPNATVRVLMDQQTSDYITLNGNGTLRASFYNKGPFHMFGTYTVERGTYGITIQNIIKKNFTFQDGGTIVFGGDPFDAALNLNALYTVNGVSLSDLNIGNSFANNTIRVNCLMNIHGTPGQPQVDFDLEMPTVNTEEAQMIRSIIASEQELNQQVLYLLGIGRFYTNGANNAGTQQYDQTQLAMQSLLSGTVSTQINELLSQIIKTNDWNFGANISTGNEGWHNAEYEGIVSGRMLNNRLLINGQIGYRDNATQATPSFIGDFDLRYLLTPSGSLALKVYNQTNDRYFTRSSLNTQGVGLVMKKDFDSIFELLPLKKRRK